MRLFKFFRRNIGCLFYNIEFLYLMYLGYGRVRFEVSSVNIKNLI